MHVSATTTLNIKEFCMYFVLGAILWTEILRVEMEGETVLVILTMDSLSYNFLLDILYSGFSLCL